MAVDDDTLNANKLYAMLCYKAVGFFLFAKKNSNVLELHMNLITKI